MIGHWGFQKYFSFLENLGAFLGKFLGYECSGLWTAITINEQFSMYNYRCDRGGGDF